MVAHLNIGESFIILFLADLDKLDRIPIATLDITLTWLKISMSIQLATLMLTNMAVGNV